MLKYYLSVSADTTSGQAAWGYIAYNSEGTSVKKEGAVDPCSTTPKMALHAALSLLSSFSGTQVEVITQSNYLIQLIEKNLDEWEKNGWKKSNDKTPENLLLVKKLSSDLKDLPVKPVFRQPKTDLEVIKLNFVKKMVVKNRKLQKVVG